MEEPTKDEAIAYVRKLKKNLSQNHKTYERVVLVCHDFYSGMISPPSVVSTIQGLFDGESDLMHGFNAFIPKHCNKLSCTNVQETEIGVQETGMGVQETEMGVEETDVSDESSVRKKKIEVPMETCMKDVLRAVEFVKLVQKRLKKHPRTMRKFYHVMGKYGNNYNLEFLKSKLSVVFKKYPELEFQFSQFCCGSNEEKSEEESGTKKNVMEEESGSAKNVMEEESGTTNNVMEEESGTKKNVMDDFEDAMFQVDMLMNWMKSAKEATQRLFEACVKNPTQRIEVATYLTSMNLRSIERLYGDGTGVTMVELLHQSPGCVSSIILPRLSQKLEEIIKKQIEIRSQVRRFHTGRNNCSTLGD